MAKQTIYNAGIYVRLSQEDMRAGESLSIENQKLILAKYVKEQGWNLNVTVKRFNFFCGLLFPFVPDFSSFLSIKS